MAAVAFSLSDAEEPSPVEVVEDYYYVLLLSLHCEFALKIFIIFYSMLQYSCNILSIIILTLVW